MRRRERNAPAASTAHCSGRPLVICADTSRALCCHQVGLKNVAGHFMIAAPSQADGDEFDPRQRGRLRRRPNMALESVAASQQKGSAAISDAPDQVFANEN